MAATTRPKVADALAALMAANARPGLRPVPTKEAAAKAERVTIRYKEHGQWQAVRVFNTAYYSKTELDGIVRARIKALKDSGKSGVQAHRWTPTVFNAAGE